MARWVGHCLDLYSRENIVSQEALNAIEDLHVVEDLDAEPTVEELSEAIDAQSCGKAPGEYGIPHEIIKCGKPALLQPLHVFLCLCWREGQLPKTCAMPKSPHCTKARVTAVIVTTTGAYLC